MSSRFSNKEGIKSWFVIGIMLIYLMVGSTKSLGRSHPAATTYGDSTAGLSAAANVAGVEEQMSEFIGEMNYPVLVKRRVPSSGPSKKGHQTPYFVRH